MGDDYTTYLLEQLHNWILVQDIEDKEYTEALLSDLINHDICLSDAEQYCRLTKMPDYIVPVYDRFLTYAMDAASDDTAESSDDLFNRILKELELLNNKLDRLESSIKR
jgi:hypothetical protein